MKNKKSKLLLITGVLFIVFMQLNISVERHGTNSDIELSISSIKAIAQNPEEGGGENCLAFGARNWNQANSFKDGYDCLCKPRRKVTGNCNPE